MISQTILYFNEYFLHFIIKSTHCLTPCRNIVFVHMHIAQILNRTARNSVLYSEPIYLTHKYITLAHNLPGSQLVDLSQYAHALIIDWHAKSQSRSHALQCSHEPLLIHLCFFSLSVIRDKYYKIENRLYSLDSICTCSTLKSHTRRAEMWQIVMEEWY